MNRIREVRVRLNGDGETWTVEVIKEFAPENGGGYQTFREHGGANLHRALEVAREMVTLSPARRTA